MSFLGVPICTTLTNCGYACQSINNNYLSKSRETRNPNRQHKLNYYSSFPALSMNMHYRSNYYLFLDPFDDYTLFSKVIHDNNNLPSPEETHSPNSRRILWLRDRPLECCYYFILNRIWSVNRSMSLSHFHYLRLLRLIAGCKVRRWRHFRIFYFGLYWMIFLMYFWGGLVAQRMIILFFFIHSLFWSYAN